MRVTTSPSEIGILAPVAGQGSAAGIWPPRLFLAAVLIARRGPVPSLEALAGGLSRQFVLQLDRIALWTPVAFGAGGLLFFGPLLMILFRRKYPRWWFDFNLEFQRFANRAWVYLALMDDRYPSTTDHQSVRLDYAYPDATRDLNRWLPLVKWFLAIPHYIVLLVLDTVAVFGVIVAWVAILFTGRYPRTIFDFVAGVIRWNNRVIGYAFTLVTDRYPPFSLS